LALLKLDLVLLDFLTPRAFECSKIPVWIIRRLDGSKPHSGAALTPGRWFDPSQLPMTISRVRWLMPSL
jgi:hypothetical protein